MTDRSDVLRRPEGLNDEGARWWDGHAPDLWKRGLLTSETRDDVIWMARVYERLQALQRRAQEGALVFEQDGEPFINPAAAESTRLGRIHLWLRHRYGITREGRQEMKARGGTPSPNPIPTWMLDEDEEV